MNIKVAAFTVSEKSSYIKIYVEEWGYYQLHPELMAFLASDKFLPLFSRSDITLWAGYFKPLDDWYDTNADASMCSLQPTLNITTSGIL